MFLMKKHERFAATMRRVLEETGTSATELARMVGFKSRNSLFRILNDETSSEVERNFFQTLRERQCLQLPDETWSELEEALEISRVGYSDYLSNQAISGLLTKQLPPPGEYMCIQRDAEGRMSMTPLGTRLAELCRCDELEICMTGCCSAPLLQALATDLRTDSVGCRLSVTHYLFAGDDEIVQNVAAIQPLLYATWYQAYFIEPNTCAPETEALLRVNSLFIHTTRGREERYELMTVMDAGHILCRDFADDAVFRRVSLLRVKREPMVQQVKSSFSYLAHTPEDYLTYTENYRQLESNCVVLSLKPDVPINFIHPDVLLGPVMDGFKEAGFAEQEELRGLVQRLYDIQLQRYENFFRKKKVTHTIFSLKAMERFVRTGRQSDHFFAMRPYTPSERKAILTNLREQSAHNPYFWVYFLKDDADAIYAEITMYEGRGVMFLRSDTAYHLDGDHCEALINYHGLSDKFRSFYMKELLVNRVLSYQDTIATLDRMIYQLG